MTYDPTPFAGLTFIESEHCTIPQERTVQRSWRERWLSWPWRPWQQTRVEVYRIPNPDVYQIGHNIFVGHPTIIARIKAGMSAEFHNGKLT